jgi:glucokinase
VLAGEIWKGNARGFDNVVVVTLGTGLGFTFTENRIIQLNSLGGPLISAFRLPYGSGILEDYVSKRGFLRLYQEISSKENIQGIKVSDIGKWADQGDETSIRTFHEAGKIFSESLKNILIEKNIQCILFGGQISWSFHHLEGALKEGLREVSSLTKISTVKSIENSALWGIVSTLGKLN